MRRESSLGGWEGGREGGREEKKEVQQGRQGGTWHLPEGNTSFSPRVTKMSPIKNRHPIALSKVDFVLPTEDRFLCNSDCTLKVAKVCFDMVL